MADLLVSYLSKVKTNNTQAAAPLDINTANRIQPFADKGTLLPSRIFGSPIQYAKDLGKDVVNIGKGVKGKSNDHNLGRMNDVGMKVGSLAIATYLFMKNPLKLSKTMEFVGFGSFFASMALWPKLFIQLPLKLRTGVDIHRKYQDSENRKKLFFQDPKYVPWSLVSQEELDKIGDKNGISRDLPNRNDAIKATAQKIAVQGNTLWMMTAGFATPIMSSLICSGAEKLIAQKQLKTRLDKSSKNLSELMDPIKKQEIQAEEYKKASTAAKENLERIFKTYGDKEMTEEVINSVANDLSVDLPSCRDGIIKQLKSMSGAPLLTLNEKAIAGLLEDNEELFDITGINSKEFKEIIETTLSSGKPYEQATESVISEIMGRCGEEVSLLEREALKENLSNSLRMQTPISRALTVNARKAELTKMSDLFANFNADRAVFQEYINARVAQTPDSFIAHQWGKVNNKFFEILGINKDDIIKAKAGGMDTKNLLVSKLEALSKTEHGEYENAIQQMAAAIEEYDQTLSTRLIDPISGKSFEETVKAAIGSATGDAATKFKNAGFGDIAETFVGQDIEKGLRTTTVGSLKNALEQMVDYEMLGARACFYRMFESLDVFRRINSGTVEKQLRALGGHIDGLNASPRQIQEFLWEEMLGSVSGRKKGEVKNRDLKVSMLRETAGEHKLVQRLAMMSVDVTADDKEKAKIKELIQKFDEIMGLATPEEREQEIKKLLAEKYPAPSQARIDSLSKLDALVKEYVTRNVSADALVNEFDTIKKEPNLTQKLYRLMKDDSGKAEWIIKQVDEIMGTQDIAQREQAVRTLIKEQFAGSNDAKYIEDLTKDAVEYIQRTKNVSSLAKTIANFPPMGSLAQELFQANGYSVADELGRIMCCSDVEKRKGLVKSLVEDKLGQKQKDEELAQITEEALDYVKKGFAKGHIGQILAPAQGRSDIREALEGVFGRKIKLASEYHNALQSISDAKWSSAENRKNTEYIIEEINRSLANDDIAQIEAKITNLISEKLAKYNDAEKLKGFLLDFVRNNKQKDALSNALRDYEDNRLFWANIADSMSNYDNGRIEEIIGKIKNTITEGKITLQTEKLFASADEYRAIMHILYQQDFDGTTVKALEQAGEQTTKSLFPSFRKGIVQLREDFINYIGVSSNWRYVGRDLIGLEGAAKPDLKHRLVAKSLVDTIKEHADTTFNSKKWLKMFGGAAAVLVGTTLLAELFFGRKDSSIKGDNK